MLAASAANAGCAGEFGGTGRTQLVLLGTHAGPVEDTSRAQPASLLVVDGKPYLIDAGEGVSRQITAAGYRPPDIGTIFITHHHIDHNAGLGPLMSFIWFERSSAERSRPQVQIYGPPATRYLVDASLRYLGVSEHIFRAGMPHMAPASPMFRAHDIDQGGIVYQDKCVRVTAVENSHFAHPSRDPEGRVNRSYAYRFDTKFGSVVFTGDTGPSAAVTRLAAHADLLVSEVWASPLIVGHTALSKENAAHMVQEHLTPAEVGDMARAARVRAVVLTHIVDAPSSGQIAAAVHKAFSGAVLEGRDLMVYTLPR